MVDVGATRGWLSFAAPAAATALVSMLAYWLPHLDKQKSITRDLRHEVRELKEESAKQAQEIECLIKEQRECKAETQELRRRIRDLQRSVLALGGDPGI